MPSMKLKIETRYSSVNYKTKDHARVMVVEVRSSQELGIEAYAWVFFLN